MSKHTPGPWYLGDYAEVYGPVGYGQISGMSPNSNIEQRKANARLIAASPTLYEFAATKARNGDKDAAAMLDSLHLTY